LVPARIREWFGRRHVFQGDFAAVDGDRAISFLDLVDVFVAGNLRQASVSMQTVRKVYAQLARDMNVDHPFCRRELLTDGKKVFAHFESNGQEMLVDVLSKQGVFPAIILPFLKTIEYDADLLASRWRIFEDVIVDPAICYGAPVVEAVGVPTAVLAKAYQANQNDAATVAGFYGVNAKDVLAAVKFESRLAA
jgi:uncharacterized protein (DUF433 family)